MCTSSTRLLWSLMESREHADLQSCCEDHCINMFFFSFSSQSSYSGVEMCSAGKTDPFVASPPFFFFLPLGS